MSDVIITLRIPESLAKEAEHLGLLSNERLIALLLTEVHRSAPNIEGEAASDINDETRQASLQYMREAAAKLRALEPPLTLEEIEEGVRAARHESSS